MVNFVSRLAMLMFAVAVTPLNAQAPKESAGPTTSVKGEYLMTVFIPVEYGLNIDSSITVYKSGSDGSWVQGPRIKGTLLAPAGDWLRPLPSGVLRLDARAVIKTDDGALIYASYNGIIKESAVSKQKGDRGEVIKGSDIAYFITAPTFETSSPKYAWLNEVQTVGKMVELKVGPGGYVKYDIFAIQ